MKLRDKPFNDNLKNAERQAVFYERLCKSGGAPSFVKPVACPVLSRSSFGVDAQQLVAVDLDSRVRRSLWISGANVNDEQYPQIPTRKLLDEEERASNCGHEHPFTSLLSVCPDDGVCGYVVFLPCR